MFVWLFCGFHASFNNFYILSVLWEEKEIAAQCSGNKNKSRIFVYNFNENGRICISSSMVITKACV
jgi:hypothetical protein